MSENTRKAHVKSILRRARASSMMELALRVLRASCPTDLRRVLG